MTTSATGKPISNWAIGVWEDDSFVVTFHNKIERTGFELHVSQVHAQAALVLPELSVRQRDTIEREHALWRAHSGN